MSSEDWRSGGSLDGTGDFAARSLSGATHPSVQSGPRRVSNIENLGCCVEQGAAFFKKVHADDAVHGATGAVAKCSSDRFQGSHRDLEFTDHQLAEDYIVERGSTHRGTATGSIDDL